MKVSLGTIVWELVMKGTDDYFQTIYVTTPRRSDAIRLAVEKSDLVDPKVTSTHKYRFNELDEGQRELVGTGYRFGDSVYVCEQYLG